jgi:RND family efflux transporter MFP subunit
MNDEPIHKPNTALRFNNRNLVELIPRFKLKQWRLVSASAITILVLFGFATTFQRQDTEETPVISILPVKTQRIETVKSYQVLQTYTGEVAALRASELGFERAGRVIWLKVDRGDRVAEGTPLAKLDTSDLETQRQELVARRAQAMAVLEELKAGPRPQRIAAARAQVRNLEELLQLEEIKRSRRKNLYTQGAISQEQYDEVAFNANALSERLAAARSELDELLAGTRIEQIAAQQAVVKQLDASISQIEITIAKSTIKAPFSGTIAARRLDEGTVVNAAQPVVRLVENAKPEVEIGVPVEFTTQIKPGSRQTVQVGQQTYQARVTSILPEVNPATRTRTVVLTIEDLYPESASILPGQIARLTIEQTVPTTGYWLPITALVRGERGLWSSYALSKAENSPEQTKSYRVERRDVEVLHTQGNRVLVRGTLRSNDMVIVDGTQRIVPGQLVRPVE